MNPIFVDVVLIVVAFTGGFLTAALMAISGRNR